MIHDPQHTIAALRVLPDTRLVLTFADGFSKVWSTSSSRRKPGPSAFATR
ncbi:MAG: hypothetical protein GXC76_00560 [Rhodanobacteraceae bacterium]|nr:hypothetical protein [Rhodanobacteraceae bacterium]